ncbi:hypothetical protein N2152v2_002311 [Parachlorella kessleri]
MGSLEQTLFVHKEVDLYKIPPRFGAGGHRSGDWRTADKIYTARCKVVAQGERLEVRLEDPNSAELFGLCPIPRGQLHIAVEQATDSSRNFVLRLEDPATKRHAFLGMSFSDRSAAFDFNVALTDHERQLQREADISKIVSSADPMAAAQEALPEAATLYKHQDLSLKEGETIRIAVRKPGSSASAEASGDGSSGFLSRLGNLPQPSSSTGSGVGAKLMPLAPPPSDLPAAAAAGLATAAPRLPVQSKQPGAGPAPASAARAAGISSQPANRGAASQSTDPFLDLLGLDTTVEASSSSTGGVSGAGSSTVPAVQGTLAAFESFQPFAAQGALGQAGTGTQQQQQQQQQQNAPQSVSQQAAESGWATFE